MKKSLTIFLILITFLVFIGGMVRAVGPCQPCPNGVSDCDSGLTCEKGKCRGCPASAEGGVVVCNPVQICDFEEVIGNIIDLIFKIAVILAPLMIVVGGVLFVSAAGNLERVAQAKRILIWTAIGFLVVLLSKGIVGMIETILGRE